MTLELGLLCGWSPMGTRQIGWPTDYSASDGQTVTQQDAASLADALDRAAAQGQRAVEQWQAGQNQPAQTPRTPPSGFAWFTTSRGRDHLRRL